MRARGKSDSKTDSKTDRHTHTHTHRRIVQNHFSRRFGGCTSQIRSYLEVDFLHDANTSIDMEVKCLSQSILGRQGAGDHEAVSRNTTLSILLERKFEETVYTDS